MYENETKIILDEAESMSVSISRVTNNAIHIYSHLMKCTYHSNRMNHSWINTIYKCWFDLTRVSENRISSISNNQNIMDEIRTKAINEYHDDGDPNGEIEFTIVINYFPTILDIASIDKLKEYLLMRAKNIGDSNAINYINTGYINWINKGKKNK